MSLRRLLVVWRTTLADNLLRSLLPIAIVSCIAITSPSDSAKSFALFPGWSLAGLVGKKESSEPGAKPYTGRRIANDTLRMIYYHDQTVAVVELGPDRLLLNCELIETYDEDEGERLLMRLGRVNRPLPVTFPQMIRLMSQCQQVEGVEALESGTGSMTPESSSNGGGGGRRSSGWGVGAARARLHAGGAHAGLLGGSPLTLLQGIIPGTKWCGTGDIASDYHDLGADRRLDRCCRTHDLCPTKVRAFSRRYNLTNNSIYSKSHCICDDMLFDCLKATNTSASQVMGHIYFNIVQVPCLEDAPAGRHFRDAKQGF